MSDNLELELLKQFKAAQERYIYFLLAVSASAIGYAITQLQVEAFNLNHIVFGASIFLWALSFMLGMKFIELTTESAFKNVVYLSLKRELKNHPKHAGLVSDFKNDLYEKNEAISNKLALYGGLQSKLLLVGAFSYIFWHALLMLSVSA